MYHSEGTFQGVRGTELYFQAWHPASPSRAVVVGMHGHGDHSGGLRNIIQHLVPQGYAWYGFDLRGHGRSPGPRGHIQKWSDLLGDLKVFLSQVRDREAESPVFLLGHSLGSLISLEYAMRHPEGLKGIITISPPLRYSGFSPATVLALRVLSIIKPDFTMEQQPDYTKLTRDPEVVKFLVADTLRHEQMTARLWRAVLDSQSWVRTHTFDLYVPLLMLYGLSDRITPAKETRQFFHSIPFANKEHHEYEQTPHRPFDDVNRAEVFGHLSAWLDKQTDLSQG
ncbi:MAG: lysophospholipase [Thermacetogeniaceae bacterium]